jgi:hypothetical protein
VREWGREGVGERESKIEVDSDRKNEGGGQRERTHHCYSVKDILLFDLFPKSTNPPP